MTAAAVSEVGAAVAVALTQKTYIATETLWVKVSAYLVKYPTRLKNLI
jgi:hypothetical protein